MRFLSIATGLAAILALPAAVLAQDTPAPETAAVSESADETGTQGADTAPAYAEESIAAGDARTRSRNYLLQARNMADQDATAEAPDADSAPAHAPLVIDAEVILPAGPNPD